MAFRTAARIILLNRMWLKCFSIVFTIPQLRFWVFVPFRASSEDQERLPWPPTNSACKCRLVQFLNLAPSILLLLFLNSRSRLKWATTGLGVFSESSSPIPISVGCCSHPCTGALPVALPDGVDFELSSNKNSSSIDGRSSR